MIKKIILLSLIGLTIIIVFCLVLFTKPNQDTFTMEIITNSTEYPVNDNINIQVYFRNNSIGFYKARFLNEKINLIISKEGEDVFLTQLAYFSSIFPFTTTHKEASIQISEPGYYDVKAYAEFSINGQTFTLEKNIILKIV